MKVCSEISCTSLIRELVSCFFLGEIVDKYDALLPFIINVSGVGSFFSAVVLFLRNSIPSFSPVIKLSQALLKRRLVLYPCFPVHLPQESDGEQDDGMFAMPISANSPLNQYSCASDAIRYENGCMVAFVSDASLGLEVLLLFQGVDSLPTSSFPA